MKFKINVWTENGSRSSNVGLLDRMCGPYTAYS